MNKGLKETENKLEYDIYWEFIEQMALRMSENKNKYPRGNWKKPITKHLLEDAIFRHYMAYKKGDRSENHLAAIACNSMMLDYQEKEFPELSEKENNLLEDWIGVEKEFKTTNITKEDWGVHITHCCLEHGCKYGDDECPVELGLVKQQYSCEMCKEDKLENDNTKLNTSYADYSLTYCRGLVINGYLNKKEDYDIFVIEKLNKKYCIDNGIYSISIESTKSSGEKRLFHYFSVS